MWRLEGVCVGGGGDQLFLGRPPALSGSLLTRGTGFTSRLFSGRSYSGSRQMTSGFDFSECHDLRS